MKTLPPLALDDNAFARALEAQFGRRLEIAACGPRHAIASWGRWSAEGSWVWHWKDYLDRGFIARHRCAAILPV